MMHTWDFDESDIKEMIRCHVLRHGWVIQKFHSIHAWGVYPFKDEPREPWLVPLERLEMTANVFVVL